MKREIICGIYMITSPTGKIYIGQALDIYLRWKHYDFLRCKPQKKIYHSLKKYGIQNHKFEIIHECVDTELEYFEKALIKLFDTFNTPHGLNLTSGGKHGKLSEKTKQRMSKSQKGKKRSEESKIRYSEGSKKGWENKVDRTSSMQAKTKISKSLIGNKRRKGIKHTDEDKIKIGEASKIFWKKKKEDPEYNSIENKQKRSEMARNAAKIGAIKRIENPIKFSDEERTQMSLRSKGMWAKRRLLGLKNKPETKKRKQMSEATRQIYVAARKREIESTDYYSEENINKRSENQKKAYRTRRENELKRIEQEKLTMIF